MDSCILGNFICHINWLWLIIAAIVVFGVGAFWYSKLFGKEWTRVFKVEMPAEGEKVNVLPTMLTQFIATILLGLVFFVLTPFSVWISLITLIGFAAWQVAGLKFRFYRSCSDFTTATLIDVGYMVIAGIIFILFALI